MIILFPMGGTGERFRAAGYQTPKPLIDVGGIPLFQRVLSCYPDRIAPQTTYAFMPRVNFLGEIQEITHKFSALHQKYEFYPIMFETKGPVDTILSISPLRALLDNRRELLIADCDSLIATTELEDALRVFRSQGSVGGVLVRRTDDPACSYAKIGSDMHVTETAEKKVISEWSTTGPYWWREARDFLRCALLNSAKGQYSVSPCYNQLIEEGRKVRAFRTLTFKHLGTPELLEAYAEDIGIKVAK